MRPRFLISILILVVAILAVVFWLRPVRPPANPELAPINRLTNNVPATVAGVASQSVSGTPSVITSPATPIPSATTNRPSPQDVIERFIESRNKPIDFYGQVIDQDSNPVPNAKVDIGIRHLKMPDLSVELAASDTIHLDQVSDVNGRFEFHGATGDGFGIGITKDGYELEPNRYGFGPTAGNYENPVIFKMWSTNIHEQLITGKKNFPIVPDGRPYFINLTDGTISESGEGDLKVWIQYTNQPVQGQLSDWSSEIDVINGGLLEETNLNAAMFSTPAEGYVPSFIWKNQIKGGQRGSIGTRRFYVMLKNGQEYGRITIELHAPFNNQIPGMVNLSYVINPDGSRILR
jgi:hypothetical protein